MFRQSWNRLSLALTCAALVATAVTADAQTFVNETTTRLVSGASPAGEPAPNLGSLDNQEKDYAWGDVDNDGDIDLICVRKEPFTTVGRRVNVLFMNEGTAEGHPVNGVLVDRTMQYASASDIPGDLGFNTPTNDRDVVLVDVNADGWLDIATAVTLSDNQPKHIKMPRIYVNLGEVAGAWQGFQYQDAWIPDLSATTGVTNSSPRFCSLAAGDFTGDGLPDIYFGDYDAQGAGAVVPMLFDYNDRLLVNLGGSFADQTTTRFVNMLQPTGFPPQPFYQSTFSASTQVADMNQDGLLDIVKQSSLQDPRFVAISYGDMLPGNMGRFDSHDEVYNQAAYFVALGDLNNDGWNDVVVVDDFQDRYLLNQANTAPGAQANFTSTILPGSLSEFGGNAVIADLDLDGWNDIITTDVDVDIPGCNRSMRIFRNNANAPSVTFTELAAAPYQGATARPQGVHDAAVFDLNGDGYLDMIIGTCTGTQVWVNDPPVDIVYDYPLGLPSFVTPGQPFVGQVEVTPVGGAVIVPGSIKSFIATDGGLYAESNLTNLGGNLYQYTLPAAACGSRFDFYFSAQIQGGPFRLDPSAGAGAPYAAQVGDAFEVVLDETFEAPASAWTVVSTVTGSPAFGAWEQVVPVGTFQAGVPIAPSTDAGPGADTMCFVTQNGLPGAAVGANDVDNLNTSLISPVFGPVAEDATLEFDYWAVSRLSTGTGLGNDRLVVSVSNNGGTNYVQAASLGSDSGAWVHASLVLSDFVTPTSNMRVRFTIDDSPNNDLTEAAVDNVKVTQIDCGSGAPLFRRGDVNVDGNTDISDPIALLDHLFGSGNPLQCSKSGDCNDDGSLNVADAVSALNALFGIGAPLPPPTGACGDDPTSDPLTCDNYPSCP
ncbi:MAG: FG-GAP-like repeat-containing protein [Planctomycetota bacterium]